MPGNLKIMTTLKTFKALINGTLFKVEQQHFGGQDIRYKLHEAHYKIMGFTVTYGEQTFKSNDFWRLCPQIIND